MSVRHGQAHSHPFRIQRRQFWNLDVELSAWIPGIGTGDGEIVPVSVLWVESVPLEVPQQFVTTIAITSDTVTI